jgi:hypothetical protein
MRLVPNHNTEIQVEVLPVRIVFYASSVVTGTAIVIGQPIPVGVGVKIKGTEGSRKDHSLIFLAC